MTTVEPAVGSPGQAVDDVVFRFEAPAVEHDFGRAVRNVVVIAIGNKNQLRREAEPDPAEADRDAGKIASFVPENPARIEMPIAVVVFENQDAVPAAGSVRLPHRIGETLDDPEPTAFVGGHRDRLNHIRFAGKERDMKTLGHGHALSGLDEREGSVFGFGSKAWGSAKCEVRGVK